MTLAKVKHRATAELKAERERDKIQAMRDYEAETFARQANMIRLRALRLAKKVPMRKRQRRADRLRRKQRIGYQS